MPESFSHWFQGVFEADAGLSWTLLLERLLVAFIAGCVIAGIYRVTHARPGNQSRALMATLVLLTVLIAMMTIVIGNNVARAFSLVGALAIVRFRTVVEDTRDTAFVIFAVSIGMALGAGYFKTPLLAIPIAGVAAVLFSPRKAPEVATGLDFELTVRVGIGADEAAWQRVAAPFIEWSTLKATMTTRQGTAFETVNVVRLRREENARTLVSELHRLEGIQGVELRRL